jgi:DNA-binding beta-propeller fold protein YncE
MIERIGQRRLRQEVPMKRILTAAALLVVSFAPVTRAQQPSTDSPYKVLQRAKVGGEGGTDYITADPVGRRLYIPRGAVRAAPATESTPERAASPARISVFDLDNVSHLIGEIETGPNSQGNGAAIDPKSGHGFSSSRPQITMFDTKTLKLVKSIPIDSGFGPDGILFDGFNDRVYVFSHPTKDAMVIDSKEGTVLGRIALDGVPEQAVADGKGTMYVVLQDRPIGGVAVVDVKTMKKTAYYPFPDIGGCNGLALDDKNKILFAACAQSGNPPAQPAAPKMVVLSAKDGKILTTLPLAGGSDGAAFNPATMEAFSTHGNGTLTVVKETSPTTFEVEENLQTMNGARTITFDPKTQHIFTMSVERGPAPPPPAGGGRGGQAPAIPGSFTVLVVGK